MKEQYLLLTMWHNLNAQTNNSIATRIKPAQLLRQNVNHTLLQDLHNTKMDSFGFPPPK